LTVGAGANRALVAQIVWSGTVTSPSLRWDSAGTNQALAQITNAGVTNTVRSELWGLVAPTSGAKNLAASWTTARDVCVNGVAWTGVDQTGGVTSFAHGTSGTGNSTAPSTGAVTSAVGNAVMAAHCTQGAPISVNNTQTFLDTTPATMSGAGNRAAGAATVTMTATLSGSALWASVGADIVAAGAGGAAQVPYQPWYQQAPVMAQ
jgi:hypothetical protein